MITTFADEEKIKKEIKEWMKRFGLASFFDDILIWHEKEVEYQKSLEEAKKRISEK